MFDKLDKINKRPKPFEFYTAESLWTDEHVSKQMLKYHLNEDVDLASRNRAFIDKSADWIISRFNIGAQTKICDFGCGPGLYTTRFAEVGAEVTGVDFSKQSIEYATSTAAEKKLDIDYVIQNYLEFSTDKKSDLITMIFCDFCPLSPAQRKTLLGIFHQCLNDGGSIFLDVVSLNYFDSVDEGRSYEYAAENGFWAADPYYAFTNTFKYEKEKVTLGKHTIVEKARTREIYNWLQCFSLESLKEEFEQNGFRITEHYSDVAGTPYSPDSKEIAIVANKVK